MLLFFTTGTGGGGTGLAALIAARRKMVDDDEYEKTSLQHEPSVVVEDYVNKNFSPEEMEKWGY